MNLRKLLDQFGQLYSSELGIDLEKPFEWLLASILFGNRISTSIAKRTFLAYRKAGLTNPESIARASWGDLVKVHGEGGYVRYDGITATYVKEVADKVISDFGGDLKRLDREAEGPRDLERRLMEFKGVGPVTAKIFLRELRDIWRNADPELTEIELKAALEIGILDDRCCALEKLKSFWEREAIPGYSLRNLQAALVRIGLQLRRGTELKKVVCGDREDGA